MINSLPSCIALRMCPSVSDNAVSADAEAELPVFQVFVPLEEAPEGIASLQRTVKGFNAPLSVRLRATKWFLKGTIALQRSVLGQFGKSVNTLPA